MSASTHYEDTVSVDDVIDLNQDCSSSSDGRSTSQHHYRISLHSIDDDELRLFRRDLVTPAPSVCGGDDVDVIKRNMIRGRFVPPSRIQRPVSRGESVMLFKKINNGDADVSFDDLVSSELRDFLDTDFMMDGILSRPVSRTTIDKNASKIQDISKFRSSVVSNNNEQKHPANNQRTMLPSKLRSLSASKSHPAEIQAQEKSRSTTNHPQRMLSSVPESPRLYQNTHRSFHHRAPIAATNTTRDDYLCKQMPKKSVTMIPKQTTLSRDKHIPRNTAAVTTSPSPSQPHKFVHGHQTAPMSISTRRQTTTEHAPPPKPTRNYGRKLPDPVVEQPPLTPRFSSRKFVMPSPQQQRNTLTHNSNYLSRTRSDTTTTTTTSSSDEDEPNEEPLFATHSYHRSYSSGTAVKTPPTLDHYNSSSPLFHRYNKTMEYKSLSSPRLRTMSSHKTFPAATIVNSNHSSISNGGTAITATTTTTMNTTTHNDDAGVIDSAKQHLWFSDVALHMGIGILHLTRMNKSPIVLSFSYASKNKMCPSM
ncbi:hypothetical protein MUCCIDRAFT_160676 [Mucor lusitanicus CBS 277.49]|uniref:Uncharacterized protein n=1 Tax=Mucor lusitanicus CBS 277.49 TaxID=747725 RepID=A0A162R058_MUCCL|nr:hypothetical protein MUCCIDRAFT_160676 [Mucor lusitanicus CBS 277.49]